MIMKKILLLITTVVLLSSCWDNNNIVGGDYFLGFRARECTYIDTRAVEIYNGSKDNHSHKEDRFIDDKTEIDSKDFRLWLTTGMDSLKYFQNERYYLDYFSPGFYPILYDAYLEGNKLSANRDKYIETQLNHDYRAKNDKTSSFTRTNRIPWPYRITGIKKFKIISLSRLFGEKAESNLNRYFLIDELSPRQVISFGSKNLIWGYSDNEKLEDIEEWLSVGPMAPPNITFKMKEKPKELPAKISFVTILETTDNKVLRDTISVSLK